MSKYLRDIYTYITALASATGEQTPSPLLLRSRGGGGEAPDSTEQVAKPPVQQKKPPGESVFFFKKVENYQRCYIQLSKVVQTCKIGYLENQLPDGLET